MVTSAPQNLSLSRVGSSNLKGLAVFAAACLLGAELGHRLSFGDQSVTPFWPPCGLFLAALVSNPVSVWPRFLLVSFCADLFSGVWLHNIPLPVSVAFYAGNAAEACVGAWLLRRFLGPNFSCSTPRELIGLSLWSAVLSTTISATTAIATMAISRPIHDFWVEWRIWWASDALGILLVAPVLLLHTDVWRRRESLSKRVRLVEFTVVLGVLLALAYYVFGGSTPQSNPFLMFPMLLTFPFLLWIGFRHGPRLAAVASFLMAVVVIRCTTLGRGPFVWATKSTVEQVTLVQVYLGINVLTVMLLSSAAAARSLMELVLRMREEAYRSLARVQQAILDAANYSIISTDPSGTILTFNAAAERLLGFAEKDVIGNATLAVFHDTEELAARARELTRELGVPIDADFSVLAAKASRGKLEEREWTYVRKDGSRFPVLLSLTAIKGEDGGVSGYLGIGRDMTEKVAAEEALRQAQQELEARVADRTSELARLNLGLRESEARFRQLADAMPQIVWTAWPDGLVDYYNDRWYEFTGLPREGGVTDGWKTIIHPDDNQRCVDAWSYAVRTGQPYEFECRFRDCRTGNYRWHLSRALPVTDDFNRIVRWYGTCTDIDDKRHAEELLRRSEAKFRGIVEAANEGIWILDEEARILFVNPQMAEMLGYTPSEILGQFKWDLLFEEDLETVKALFDRRRQGLNDKSDVRFRRKDGGILWTIMAARPIFDDRGSFRGALDLFTDITERKDAESQIRQLNETLERRVAERTAELEAANAAIVASSTELKVARDEALASTQAKAAFLANISHEVRTPMSAVLGYAEMLLNPDLERADRDHALQAIRRNGTHLLQVINDVLDLSKIEAGRIELEMIRYSPWQLLLEVASTVRLHADEKQISLQIQPMGRLPSLAMMDPTRIRQILMNLVSNAIKFSEPGGSVILRIGIKPLDQGRRMRLVIDIEDRGIGMTPSQLGLLFTPFQQADSSTTRRFGGTGLGLSISRRLAEAMDGEILVQSTYGAGSCFSLSVPLRMVDDNVPWLGINELESHAANEIEPVNRLAKLPVLMGRVLVADDCRDNQRVILHHLKQLGLETEVVENGDLAVERALSGRFDLILMDMQMPELDGYGAASSLRRSGYQGPIIALTAHAMIEDRERCLRAGCTDYLTKPVESRKLALAVARHLGTHRGVPRPDLPRPEKHAVTEEDAIVSQFRDAPGMENLLREYVESLPDKVSRLRSLLTVGEIGDLQSLAHQIKGHGGMYGYPCLSEAAGLIEEAAQERQDDELLEELIEGFADLSMKIERGFTFQTAGV